jgi:hypothetical protein
MERRPASDDAAVVSFPTAVVREFRFVVAFRR